MAMSYTRSIGNQPYNSIVVFKMPDSVPSASYSSVCNVLRQWRISIIPTYRVNRPCDTLRYYNNIYGEINTGPRLNARSIKDGGGGCGARSSQSSACSVNLPPRLPRLVPVYFAFPSGALV